MAPVVPTPRDRLIERCSTVDFDDMSPAEYAEFVQDIAQDEFIALIAMHDQYLAGSTEGLPVAGYQPQSVDAIATVNASKELEEHVLRLIDEIQKDAAIDPDPRFLASGRTWIQMGFMLVNRAVFKPGRIELDPTSAEVESGWLIERADSSPSAPLYLAPNAHGEQWTQDPDRALRLARKVDGMTLAKSLAVQVRVCEHQWG